MSEDFELNSRLRHMAHVYHMHNGDQDSVDVQRAMESVRKYVAQLMDDYTGACEAIRQLEANVAEARAEVERTNHVMRLERMARQDSEDRLKAQLTAAEAAREAVLASLAAAEAVAGEVREATWRLAATKGCPDCGRGFPGWYTGTVTGPEGKPEPAQVQCETCGREGWHLHGYPPLPTPSAALQRVREQAQREGAERALRVVWHAPALMKLDSQDEFVTRMLAAMFPTPDAGGTA